jgi:hypothetical protein
LIFLLRVDLIYIETDLKIIYEHIGDDPGRQPGVIVMGILGQKVHFWRDLEKLS